MIFSASLIVLRLPCEKPTICNNNIKIKIILRLSIKET